jgi:hypothetical protein
VALGAIHHKIIFFHQFLLTPLISPHPCLAIFATFQFRPTSAITSVLGGVNSCTSPSPPQKINCRSPRHLWKNHWPQIPPLGDRHQGSSGKIKPADHHHKEITKSTSAKINHPADHKYSKPVKLKLCNDLLQRLALEITSCIRNPSPTRKSSPDTLLWPCKNLKVLCMAPASPLVPPNKLHMALPRG